MNDHDHDHPHAEISVSEQPGYFDIMETALRELLIERRLIGPDEIRRQIGFEAITQADLPDGYAYPRSGKSLTPAEIIQQAPS